MGLRSTATSSGPPARTFIVFFPSDRVNLLLPDDKEIVRQAAESIKALHPSIVRIADEPTVAGGANPRSADPRFEAVEAELIADGVDQKLLARAALTDLDAKVGPADNRRVEIRLFTK